MKVASNFLKVFYVYTSDYCDCCTSFFSLLSKDEQLRSMSFKFENLKKNYIISHGLMRCFLSQFTGIDPSEIEYSFGPFGKPFLVSGEIRFNMSHSHNAVAYAFSKKADVGIDIEYVRPNVTLDQLPLDFLSELQIEDFFLIDQSENKKNYFYKKWSQLESYLKAHGIGIGHKIKEIKFDFINWKCYEISIDKPYVGFLTYQSIEPILTPQMGTVSKEMIHGIINKFMSKKLKSENILI